MTFMSYILRVEGNVTEVVLISLICLANQKRKKYFLLRLIACLLLIGCITCAMSYLYFLSADSIFLYPVKSLTYVLCYLSVVSIGYFCYDISKMTSNSRLLSAWAIQLITSNFVNIVVANLFVKIEQWAPIYPFFFYQLCRYLISAPIYVASYFFFVRNSDVTLSKKGSRYIVVLSFFLLFVIQTLSGFIPFYAEESRALEVLASLFCLFCGVLVLFIRSGLINRAVLEKEYMFIDNLNHQEQLRYKQLKSNMDVINIKCHDLKHIVNNIGDKLDQHDLNELQSAVSSFDSAFDTNNEILNIILDEKNSYCVKHRIRFTCMGDASGLSFMQHSDIYSLFGNAIDNAIEAVEKFSTDEKKSINLCITNYNSVIKIDLMNYYDGELTYEDGIPVTKKEDKRYHGFGIKSMKMIVAKYKGKFYTFAEDGVFRFCAEFKV